MNGLISAALLVAAIVAAFNPAHAQGQPSPWLRDVSYHLADIGHIAQLATSCGRWTNQIPLQQTIEGHLAGLPAADRAAALNAFNSGRSLAFVELESPTASPCTTLRSSAVDQAAAELSDQADLWQGHRPAEDPGDTVTTRNALVFIHNVWRNFDLGVKCKLVDDGEFIDFGWNYSQQTNALPELDKSTLNRTLGMAAREAEKDFSNSPDAACRRLSPTIIAILKDLAVGKRSFLSP